MTEPRELSVLDRLSVAAGPLKQKLYTKAIRDYTKSLKLYSTDAWALWNRGLAWKGLGEIEKADTDQVQAKEIDPTFPQTH